MLKEEFNSFFDKSPFASAGKESQIYSAMYGSFLGGYALSQEHVIAMMAKGAAFDISTSNKNQ